MTTFRNTLFVILVLQLCACGADNNSKSEDISLVSLPTDTVEEDNRPNILFILADDLGYSDLGVFGSEIPTPTLDDLANNGLILTDFHTSLACSPTRSMLMSGTDNHLAGLAVMNPPTREDQLGQPGYEAYLNDRVASLADLMTDAGYNTYMTGKWHLGEEVETGPRARGFKRSFVSLSGGAHLSGLSWDGPGLAPYRDGDEAVNVSDDFYTTQFYTDRMLEYIEEDRDDGKPFFAYLAYTAPHWPLQAPQASIAKFEGWYDEGYEELYKSRFNSMQQLNYISPTAEALPSDSWQPTWDELSEEEKRIEARKMEIYAAMVSDLDSYIGKVINYLKSIDEYENTFIMFMSDNGAESNRRELAPPLSDWVASCCDNSYDNLGKGDSYVMYGPNWATASTVLHRRHKATAFEGGMRVPAFVHFPKLVESGGRSSGFSTIMDLLPTFLELAESEHPGTSYKGQTIHPVKGKSLIPQLTGQVESVHSDIEFIGWELYGHRSIRQGDWKIVWDASQGDDAKWMLFNLERDLAEQTDLAIEQPTKLADMISLWDQYALENGVIY